MAASPSIAASTLIEHLGDLPGARGSFLLDRPSTAERVADRLRESMVRGEIQPGWQMAEQQLTAALGVSRNTLREAFQILIGERLLTREPHRGVFVRRLVADDVRDIYAFRMLVESGALAHPVQLRGLAEMRAAVTEGQSAARRRLWHDVGTADVRFHMGVTTLVGSARLDRVMRSVFAELRLAFQLGPDPRALHEPFLSLNADICALAERGDSAAASAQMRAYLVAAQEIIVAAVDAG